MKPAGCRRVRGRRDSQIGKVAIRVASGPKGDFATNASEFQVVDEKAGLGGSVDVEPGLHTRHDDAKAGPYSGLEVRIGFVERRRFGSRAFKRKIRHGDVLQGVIAALLIVRASVGHAQVEAFEPRGALEVESDADRTAGRVGSAGGRRTRKIELDGPVFKIRVGEDDEGFSLRL